MAARYLKSLATGVVLPYSEPALKSADIRLMEPAECEEYEASLGIKREAAPEPAPAPEPEPEFDEVKIETSFTPTPEPEPEPEDKETAKVIAALEVE